MVHLRFICCFFILLTCLSTNVNCQDSGSYSKREGLKLPFNSSYDELNPVPWNNGQAIYFTRSGHPDNRFGSGNSQDIWKAHINDNGEWTEATRLPDKVNLSKYNTVFNTFNDGKQLLISGIYTNKGRFHKRGLSFISFKDSSWGRPKALDIPAMNRINDGKYFSAWMNEDKDLLLLSCTKNYRGEEMDLYLVQKEQGEWEEPVKLEAPVSSDYSDESPSLSPGGDTLFFASNRADEKDFDVYYCTRQDNDPTEWSNPKAFENVINSTDFESYFRLGNKNRKGFYVSENLENENSDKDIYTLIMPLTGKRTVALNGRIEDKIFNAPVPDSISWEVNIVAIGNHRQLNNILQDSLKTDAASFSIGLPRNFKYGINFKSEDFPEQTDTIKVTNKTEGPLNHSFEIPLNIPVKARFSFKGPDSNEISEKINPEVVINGEKTDLDKDTSNKYFTNLQPGMQHTIEVRSDSFKTVQKVLDLSNPSNKETDIAFHLKKKVPDTPEKPDTASKQKPSRVVISGEVFNKQTEDKVKKDFMIIANSDTMKGKTSDGEYKVRLKPGKEYTLSAWREGYISEAVNIKINKESESQSIQLTLKVTPIQKGGKVSLNNIYFNTGEARLLDSSYKELNRLVDLLKNHPDMEIEIQGHTDNVGGEKANQELSEKRAKAVEDYLIAQGISKDRLKHKGFGEERPLWPNSTPEGRQKNRRVEFEILETGE